MSPHGVFHDPKSAASLPDAVESASSRWSAVACASAYSSTDVPAFRASAATIFPSSSPQYTASDVAAEFADQRRSQERRSAIWSASFFLSGSEDAFESHAAVRAGIDCWNAGRELSYAAAMSDSTV